MATKIKISELPECRDFRGLKTIGTDAQNRSVAVSLGYVHETVEEMKTATENTRTAIADAESATETIKEALVEAEKGEAVRIQAETEREAAEAARTEAESVRGQSEAARVAAEERREAQERERVSAESRRVSAESVRESQHNSRYEQMMNASGKADEAVRKAEEVIAAFESKGLCLPQELHIIDNEYLPDGVFTYTMRPHRNRVLYVNYWVFPYNASLSVLPVVDSSIYPPVIGTNGTFEVLTSGRVAFFPLRPGYGHARLIPFDNPRRWAGVDFMIYPEGIRMAISKDSPKRCVRFVRRYGKRRLRMR